jgi:predicted aspartyl protease
MLRKYALILLILAARVLPAHAQHMQRPSHMSPMPVAVTVPPGGAMLPMANIGGRPVVEVRINGRGPYRFILDTGASITVVDESLQDSLRLPVAEGIQAAAQGHGPSPSIVTVQKLTVGGATLEGVTAAMMPIGRMFTGDQKPQGVLSASSFPGHLVTFDYPGKRITIVKGKLPDADARTIFSYDEDDPLPNLPVRIAGHLTRLHLDTGSGSGVMIPNQFLNEIELASKPESAGTAHVHNGEYPVMKASVKGAVEIGSFKLATTEVRFSDLKPGMAPPKGNLGYDVLKDFVVTLDSRNRRIRLQR